MAVGDQLRFAGSPAGINPWMMFVLIVLMTVLLIFMMIRMIVLIDYYYDDCFDEQLYSAVLHAGTNPWMFW